MSRPAGFAPSVSGIKQHLKTYTTNTSNLTNLLLRPRIEHKNRCLSEEEKGSHRGNLYKCCHCAASKLSAKKFFTHLENHVSAVKDNQGASADDFSSGCKKAHVHHLWKGIQLQTPSERAHMEGARGRAAHKVVRLFND